MVPEVSGGEPAEHGIVGAGHIAGSSGIRDLAMVSADESARRAAAADRDVPEREAVRNRASRCWRRNRPHRNRRDVPERLAARDDRSPLILSDEAARLAVGSRALDVPIADEPVIVPM